MKRSVQINLETLEQDSKIFGRNPDKKLTQYQKAVNKASLELAEENCAPLKNRGELFTQARILKGG